MGFRSLTWVYHDHFKLRFPAFEYSAVVAAGVDPATDSAIPAKAGYRIRITDVIFNVSTSANKVLTLQDDADTPVKIAIFAGNTAVGTHPFSFGGVGFPATLSKNVDIVTDGAGYAGTLQVFGFYEPVGPFEPSTL